MSQHKITNTGNATFDDGVTTSNSTFQAAVSVATTQAAADTAARAHFDRCIALAVAAGVSPAIYIQARKEVGTHA
jgi:hypothetical protein